MLSDYAARQVLVGKRGMHGMLGLLELSREKRNMQYRDYAGIIFPYSGLLLIT